MKNIALKRRTEAIAEIDGIKIFWDAQSTPYWNGETDSVHLPPIPDHEITEEDIIWVRGYIDHEKRHSIHSKGVTSERLDIFKKKPDFHQLANLLEDVRIEQKPGRSGEKINLFKLRSAMAIDVSKFMESSASSPISQAITAFAYRTHGIKFNLDEKAEKAYESLKSDFSAVISANSYNKVIDIAEKLYEKIEDEITPPPPKMKPDTIGTSKSGSSAGGSQSVNFIESDEDDSSWEDDEDSEGDEGDEGDGGGEGDEKNEEEKNDVGTGVSDDKNEDKEENSESSNSSNEEKDEDESDESNVSNSTDSSYSMEDGANLFRLSDIEKATSDEISKIKCIEESGRGNKSYTSYTLGDVFVKYEFKPEMVFNVHNDIEKLVDINTRQITKNLVKILRSKTDTYRKFGEKKGKKIAKNRIAGFAMETNDAPFYVDLNSEQIHAKVIILVDLSSSMRNNIVKASAFSYLIAKALSQLNIDFEVLGFYNVNMRESANWRRLHKSSSEHYCSPYPKVYETYHSFGKKFKPTTYVNVANQIIKNWFDSKRCLPGYEDCISGKVIKQNDDGEHVYEGAIRLLKNSKKEDKKIMFVISDGCPCSEQVYLCGHQSCSDYLVSVMNKIRQKTDIDIFGFGFEGAHSISNFYGEKNSIYIPHFDGEFANAFVKELKNKLEGAIR